MKKLMLTVFLILFCTNYSLAQDVYSDKDVDNALNEIQNNPALIDETLNKIKNDPAITGQMLNRLENEPALMQRLTTIYQNTKLREAVIQHVQADPSVANNLTLQLINNPALTRKILVNMGQDPKAADEMAKNPDLRKKMADYVKNDPAFMKEVWQAAGKK